MEWSVHWIAAALVGAVFAISGAVELLNWRKFIDSFTKWGYPRYWPLVTFSLKIIGGVMAFIPQTRLLGLALCALISLAAVASMIVHRELKAYAREAGINGVLIGLALASWITG